MARIARPLCAVHGLGAARRRNLLKMTLQRGGIEPQRLPGRIDEMRHGARMADGIRCRDEGDRRQDHLVIRLDAFQQERGMQRRRAVDDGDGMADAGRGGNHLLELPDIFAGRRYPAGIDAIEHQLPLARAEPGFVQFDRTRRGSEYGVDGVEDCARIKRGTTVGKDGGAGHRVTDCRRSRDSATGSWAR